MCANAGQFPEVLRLWHNLNNRRDLKSSAMAENASLKALRAASRWQEMLRRWETWDKLCLGPPNLSTHYLVMGE